MSIYRLRFEQKGPRNTQKLRRRRLIFEQRLGELNRDAKIRSSKTFEHGIGYADHFSLPVKQRTSRAAGGGLRVENNFVRKNIADVPLSNQRTNQVALGQLVENF